MGNLVVGRNLSLLSVGASVCQGFNVLPTYSLFDSICGWHAVMVHVHVHVHVHAWFFTSIGLVFVMWFNYMFVMQMVQGYVPHCDMHPGSWSCSYCFCLVCFSPFYILST